MTFANQFLMVNLWNMILVYETSEKEGFTLYKSIKLLNILVMAIKQKDNRYLEEYEFVLL